MKMVLDDTVDKILQDMLRMRQESMDVEWASEVPEEKAEDDDPDTRYRNELVDSISTLLSSVQQNLSKVGKEDVQHEFVIGLIDVQNKLREINDNVCAILDGANNMARQDDSSFMEFPSDDFGDGEEGMELLTGDIEYEIA